MQMGTENSIDPLVQRVVGLAMKIHSGLGMGFLESLYANVLSIGLSKAIISFAREKRIPVFYGEKVAGDFPADFGARSLQFKTKAREYRRQANQSGNPPLPSLIPSLNPFNSV